ncbi:MAG: ABC transporter ATP-binding protein [Deltaproteobacteria bacterium]|nr:ABC transporter ATP-binding protein [Deltaproteobacteria bacterium]
MVDTTPSFIKEMPDALKQPVIKLEVKDLGVTYVGRDGTSIEAVRQAELAVLDKPGVGEIVVLLGPSGCGKSTVLKCIAGLIAPTRGEVWVGGVKVEGVGRDRGMVFQQYTSFGWLSVRDNVAYGLKLAGVPPRERKEQVDHYLNLVGLYEYGHLFPKSLSGGMKQRVAIARTLINKPKLLLMDEPFGALDPHTRWEMQTLILDISRQEDNTIVLVTHDVSEAVYVADTCYVLAPRPTRILHRVDVPFFAERNAALKAAPEFRAIEKQLLDMLYGSAQGTAG